MYTILSRHYVETYNNEVVKYNLRSGNDFQPNVWEEDLTVLSIVK
nr:MAG TPA: hypothetical protein [Caudoviricetes sp.]